MMGALDWLQRKLIVATSRNKRSADFIALLVTLDHLYGPKPGVRTKPVVIVLDNGPIHVSKATAAALAARAHWLTVEWLPKYAPELNDIEVVWHDLKAFNLAHKTFTDVDTLDGHPQHRRRLEHGTKPRSVGRTENLCLAWRTAAGLGLESAALIRPASCRHAWCGKPRGGWVIRMRSA